MKFLAALLLLANTISGVCFRQQAVGVRGRLTCNNLPLTGAGIKLVDKNIIGPDIILAEGNSDRQGNYEVKGGFSSFLELNVHMKIFHDCDDSLVPCQRTVDLRIPSTYVSRGNAVTNFFDAGTMNMAFRYPDEQRSCRNVNFRLPF